MHAFLIIYIDSRERQRMLIFRYVYTGTADFVNFIIFRS